MHPEGLAGIMLRKIEQTHKLRERGFNEIFNVTVGFKVVMNSLGNLWGQKWEIFFFRGGK